MSQPGVQPFPSMPSGDVRPFHASWQARLIALLVAAYAYARAKQGERPGLPAAPHDGA